MTRLSVSYWALPIALLLLFLAATFVALGGPTAAADTGILFAMHQPALVPSARVLSDSAATFTIVPVAAVAAIWLFYRGARRRAVALILIVVSQRVLTEVLKGIFDRARPDPHGHQVAVNSMAFPSGHSANAMALGLGLALLLAPERYRGAAIAAALLFAFLVGCSRMVLGVHWPSDVAGGWALGAAWTLLLVRLAEERPRPGGIDRS